MKKYVIAMAFLMTACGDKDPEQVAGPAVEVLVPVAQSDAPAVSCQVFTNLASPLLSQVANTSKYLPLVHSVKGDIEIGLDSISLTEEANDLLPFLQFMGTAAEAVTNNFALRCSFKFEVKNAGNHIFSLNSDDGSQLFINGTRVIDNGGAHGMVLKTATVNLPVGIHEMRIVYYEGNGPKGLSLKVKAPNTVITIPEQDL